MRAVRFSFYALSLIVVEFVLCMLFLAIEYHLKYGYTRLVSNFRSSSEVNLLRLIFYLPISIAVFFGVIDNMITKLSPARMSIINMVLYLLLSIFYSGIFPAAGNFFSDTLFYFLIVSTLLSPLILSIIPPYRNWVRRNFSKSAN